MKKIVGLFLILLVTCLPLMPSEHNLEGGTNTPVECRDIAVPKDGNFTPENITLSDDVFHSDLPLHAETWYFEVICSNNYSVVLIITLLSSDGARGAAMVGLYIYREGRMEVMERMSSFSFRASDKMPLIEISGITVIDGRIEEGRLVYNISFEMNGNGIELQFVNETDGWKGEMGMGWWLAVPELHVTGKIKVDGGDMSVEGVGYHDHNIFSLLTPAVERGYMDGKILHSPVSVVWGYLMHGIWDAGTFAILSEDGRYMAVSPGSTKITFSSYVYDHGIIPTEVFVSINDSESGISARLHMTAVDFHHIRLPFLHYWRYHVKIEGEINTSSHSKKVDEIGIMERMLY